MSSADGTREGARGECAAAAVWGRAPVSRTSLKTRAVCLRGVIDMCRRGKVVSPPVALGRCVSIKLEVPTSLCYAGAGPRWHVVEVDEEGDLAIA